MSENRLVAPKKAWKKTKQFTKMLTFVTQPLGHSGFLGIDMRNLKMTGVWCFDFTCFHLESGDLRYFKIITIAR